MANAARIFPQPRIQRAALQHLIVNSTAITLEFTMTKLLAVLAAVALMAPVAYAGLYQAALIVA